MTEAAPAPLRPVQLLLLAGEQQMPNLQSVVMLAEQGVLAGVHIACSTDVQRSLGPARRLKALIESAAFRSAFPKVRPAVTVSEPGLGTQSQDIRAWAARRIATAPVDRWVVNLTGGLKSMAFGLLDLVRSHGATGIYREIRGAWIAVSNGEAGVHTAPLDGWQGAASLVDRLPVDALVRAQFMADQADAHVEVSARSASRIDDLRAITERLCAHDWDWMTAFPAHRSGHDAGLRGTAFEIWVGALLYALGAADVAHSVKISRDGKQTIEVDLVTCVHGEIRSFDLSLQDAEDRRKDRPFEQLRVAADAARLIGGTAGRAIVVRPAWARDRIRDEVASRSNVVVVDAEHAGALVERLADVLRCPRHAWSPDVVAIDRALRDYADRRGTPFLCDREREQRPVATPREGEGRPDLLPGIEQLARRANRNWAVFRIGSTLALAVLPPEPGRVVAPVDAVRARYARMHRHLTPCVASKALVLLRLSGQGGGDQPRAATLIDELFGGIRGDLPLAAFTELKNRR